MTTENKAVSVYLPKDLEACLQAYCEEWGITRKDRTGELKPVLGTAIVQILKSHFSQDNPSNVSNTLPSALSNNLVSKDEVTDLIHKVLKDENIVSNLPSPVLNTLPDNVVTEDKLESAITNLRNEFTTISAVVAVLQSEIVSLRQQEKTAKVTEPIEKPVQKCTQTTLFKEDDELPSEAEERVLEGDLSKGQSGHALARRLKKNEATIRGWKNRSNAVLADETKALDPGGIAWRYDEASKKYFPV